MLADLDTQLGPDQPVVDGTLVSVHDGRTSWVVVDFVTTDGQRVRAETEDYLWDPAPEVGDAARIRYNPDDPERYARDARFGGYSWLVALLAVFSTVLLGAAAQGWRRRLPDWLRNR